MNEAISSHVWRPSPPPDADCGDIPYTDFAVRPPDPHGFDGEGDSNTACEVTSRGIVQEVTLPLTPLIKAPHGSRQEHVE